MAAAKVRMTKRETCANKDIVLDSSMTFSIQIMCRALVLPLAATAGTHEGSVSLPFDRLLEDEARAQCSNAINKWILAKETTGWR